MCSLRSHSSYKGAENDFFPVLETKTETIFKVFTQPKPIFVHWKVLFILNFRLLGSGGSDEYFRICVMYFFAKIFHNL